MSIEKSEVLSPVGSFESLEAAVRSGADAVYLGAKEFSARRNAENFDESELSAAVKYCHIRNVKVYLALNIMVKDSEINSAIETAKTAYLCGVDALILEDFGFSTVIKDMFPDLELHASTQMTVHSPSALPILKEMGFCRVVAAREMNKHSLQLLCKKAKELNMTVEVFVHGALCMCVSGQCLLSSMLGARSGNRGLCAGPCRLPFSVSKGTGYDLSLKDLSLFDHINELKEIGVASLKIEGRMKRPEYIAAATSACRQAVDNGFVNRELSDALRGVFSRSGFTDGYFTGKVGKDMFGIRTKDDVTAAKDTFSALHELYRNERQSVEISLKFTAKTNMPISLLISDGQNSVTVFGDVQEKATNKPTTKEDIIKNLNKTGSTPYTVKNETIELDEGLFIPASAINSIRRDATDRLCKLRSKVNRSLPSVKVPKTENRVNFKTKSIIARFKDKESIPNNISNVSGIMLPWYKDFPENTYSNLLIAELPRYIKDEDALIKRLEMLKSLGINKAFCSNISALKIAKNSGFEIIGGMGLNIGNSFSANWAENQGVFITTVSPELEITQTNKINTSKCKMIFAYGRLPLMLTVNCPLKNGRECSKCDKNGVITDRKNIDFPIRCTPWYSELLNSTPIYLADRLSEIENTDYLLLYFTTETVAEEEKIIKEYSDGGKAPSEYTRGLYYRNLL